MNWFVNILLLISAHLSLTPFAPAKEGKWLLWPFDEQSRPIVSFVGGLPDQSGSIITPLLAGLAGLGFIIALLARLGWLVPLDWMIPAVVIASISSLLLFVLYFNVWSLLPIVLDIVLLWLVWTKKLI